MAAAFAGPFPLALEPMVFSGDVMQYRKWVKQFENIIEPSVKDNHLRLFYLEKYTAGEAREVIEGFLQVRRGMLEKMRLGMLTTYNANFQKNSQKNSVKIVYAIIDWVSQGIPK